MSEHWIIPCNIRLFDLIEHFKQHDTVIWRNAFTIRRGDIVYIYISLPYAQIRYKCHVISDNIDEQLLSKNRYAIPQKKSHNYFSRKDKYIQLKLLREYNNNIFPLNSLKEHGLGQIQIQARTNRTLQYYLDEVEKQLYGDGDDD